MSHPPAAGRCECSDRGPRSPRPHPGARRPAVGHLVAAARRPGRRPRGWSPTGLWPLPGRDDAALVVGRIRAPRSIGAWLTGVWLGMAGAAARGLFRNPLAEPYLLGAASGASLGGVMVLASGPLAAQSMGRATLGLLARVGLAGAAFVGAWLAMLATLVLDARCPSDRAIAADGGGVGVLLWQPRPTGRAPPRPRRCAPDRR